MRWLRDPDVRALSLWVAAGVLGLVIAVRLFFVAFPEASIDFKIAPSDATTIARDFLTARGASVTGYEASVVMKADDDAKIYLERELGLERANALMASEVTVFAFEVRLFRDLQREEYAVRVDPGGRVVGMKHVVEEERAGARLDAADARAVADAFLRSVEPRSAEYAFLDQEQSSIDRPARRDWSFTWERRDFRAGEAPYRVTVRVLGDAVGGLEPSLKVPEAWKRDFERLRSENSLYGAIDAVPFVLLVVLVIVTLVRNVRRGAVRWKGAGMFGSALAVVFAAMLLNTLPLLRAGYQTTTSYPGYLATQIVLAIVLGAVAATFIAVTFAAAEPLYRERWPERLRVGVLLRPRALGSREVFRGLVIGVSLAGASLGAQILFYVAGRSVGVWLPQDVRYTDAVGTLAPWLFPLGIGLQASTFEEGLFRLFAIPLLLSWTRARALAIVLPALVWGFGHSSYPVEPGYVRGIEVGAIGIVTGLVFLRWGILPTLVWHYTFDAALIALFLLRSSNAYFQVSGAIVGFALLVPLLASGGLILARRRTVEDPALLNRADPLPPAPAAVAVPEAARAYAPASERTLRLALAIGVTGLLAFVAVRPPESIGSFVKVPITARDAVRLADGALAAGAIDGAGWQKVATLGGNPVATAPGAAAATGGPPFDPYVNEYLRRVVGVAGANGLYADHVPSVFWRVRYFRDGVKEERTVLLRPDGTPYAILHALDEGATGPDLPQDAARAIAERYLRGTQRVELASWRLVDATSTKLPHRTDHTVVFERADPIGDAHVRAEVRISGDEVTGYRTFVKIPEAWEREQKQQTLAQTSFGIARALLVGAAIVGILVLFVRGVRRQRVPWRALTVVGGISGALAIVGSANGLPDALARYTTAIPLASYLGVAAAAAIIGAVVIGGGILLVCAAAWLFAERAFGEERLPSLRPARAYWRDALVLGAAGAGAFLLIQRIHSASELLWPVERPSLPASWPSQLDLLAPALGPISSSALAGILQPAVVFVAAALVARYLRRLALQLGAILVLAAILVGDISSPGQVIRDLTAGVLQLGLVVFWVVRFARFNVLAYVVAVLVPLYARPGIDLLQQPNAFYVGNGVALIVCAALVILVPLVGWRRTAPVVAPAPAQPAAAA